MKNLIKLSIFAFILLAGTAHATVQTIKVEVNGMVCAFCAQGIEKKLRAMPQTKDVYVNLKHKVVAVELKDGQTVSFDVVKDLVKDAGYEVSHIETINQPVQEVKASMPKD